MSETRALNVIDVDREAQLWLPCDRRLGGPTAIRDWAAHIDDALQWGTADVAWLGSLGPLEMPLALTVGAWMRPQPCCAGHIGPDANDLCSPFGGLWEWRCGGCDDYTVPDVWATMPLTISGTELRVPEPTVIAAHADGSLGKWLARYGAEAREQATGAVVKDRAEHGVELLTAPGLIDKRFAAVRLWGNPTCRDLYQPAVRVLENPPWRLEVGWWAPDPGKGDEQWGARFVTNERLQASPAALLGLISSDTRSHLLVTARRGELDSERLTSVWRHVLDDPPAWLVDDRAVASVAASADASQQARQRRAGTEGVGL